ncbi:universal stress protein [Mycobacterium gastri]|uniref:Universal stress protein n=1 Tax=Mycobacterium gastri TaxID=1777 RepID=A0A1X1V7I2_MYCGS|nr:universal stress protein [Mycobacterium gastri]ETW24336.1 universal stress protein [Mycobacterium gastri 'Wayne']ORV65020.1 universal stress protein [Mycobacterium gastri]
MSSRNAPLGIVVGIDESPSARLAVQWAARDAELRNIPLTLVHAVSPEVSTLLKMPMPAGLARWQQDRGRRLVDEALKVVDEAARGGGPAGVHTEILGSAAVPTLVDLSKDAEMVVTGCLGSRRWPGRLLGSVSSAVLRYAHCPVVIVHDDDPSVPQRDQAPVLVGIDGSAASELATAFAFDEAARRRVGLVALHAWSDIDISEWPGIDWPATQSMAEQVLAERLAGWQEQYPDVAVTRIAVQDQPARQLVDRSGQAQLVVVGSRGRGGFAGMSVGSVGEAVAQLAQVPVIVARESPA